MKRIHLFLFAFLVAVAPTFAQRGGQQGPRNEAARQHFQETILPALQRQRAELDQKLSSAEKARLAEIRAELETLRPVRPERPAPGEGPAQRPNLTEDQIREHMANRMKAEQLEAEVARIAANHLDELVGVAVEMDSLHRQARPEQRPEQPARAGQGPGPERQNGRDPGRDLRNPVHFLLWDGQQAPARGNRP